MPNHTQKVKVLTCAVCGETWNHVSMGRPPKTCSEECKKIHSSNTHRKKYERKREAILERNRQYRATRKDEIAAQVREKRARIKLENPDIYRDQYWSNRESIRAAAKIRYQRSRDKFSELNNAYYEENRESLIEWQRRYRKENRDEINQRRRQLWKENPEKYRTQVSDRRARVAGAFIESVSILELLKRDGYTCGICGGEIPAEAEYGSPLYPHIDHIIPLSKGGLHSYSNTHPAHSSCNTQKGDLMDGWQGIKPICD